MNHNNMTDEEVRQRRRHLFEQKKFWPVKMTPLPDDQWPPQGLTALCKSRGNLIEVWRSKEFLCQVFQEPNNIVRLSVLRIEMEKNGHWKDGISWDDLMRVKNEVGRGTAFAIEMYPADKDVVNVSNIRHLWILTEPLPFMW